MFSDRGVLPQAGLQDSLGVLVVMSSQLEKWTTHEREYIKCKDKFVKRSLAPHEYSERISDPRHYSSST